MYKFSVEEKLRKKLIRIAKKDKELYNATWKKIEEIVSSKNINHYKNLRSPLQHLKRVHIQESFVLTFRYSEKENKILFYKLNHHDEIYK